MIEPIYPNLQDKLNILYKQIRHIRDQRGDDKCWKDYEELFKLLPEGYVPPERDETVELDLCRQYIASCHNPCIKYDQRRIEELEAEIKELEISLSNAEDLAQYGKDGL